MPGYKIIIDGIRLTPRRKKRLICAMCGQLVRDAFRDCEANSYCQTCLTSDRDILVQRDMEIDEEVKELMLFIERIEALKEEHQILVDGNEILKIEISEMKKKSVESYSDNSIFQTFTALSEAHSEKDQCLLSDEVLPVMETRMALCDSNGTYEDGITEGGAFNDEDFHERRECQDEEEDEESSDAALESLLNATKHHVDSLIKRENKTGEESKELGRETAVQQKQLDRLRKYANVEEILTERVQNSPKNYFSEPDNHTPSLSKSSLVTGLSSNTLFTT